eukprot:scaffold46651_cov35-Prasinocladus_malaysianus.AAC.1
MEGLMHGGLAVTQNAFAADVDSVAAAVAALTLLDIRGLARRDAAVAAVLSIGIVTGLPAGSCVGSEHTAVGSVDKAYDVAAPQAAAV